MNALNTLKEVENGGKQEAKEPKIRKKKQFEVLPFHCIYYYFLFIDDIYKTITCIKMRQ